LDLDSIININNKKNNNRNNILNIINHGVLLTNNSINNIMNINNSSNTIHSKAQSDRCWGKRNKFINKKINFLPNFILKKQKKK